MCGWGLIYTPTPLFEHWLKEATSIAIAFNEVVGQQTGISGLWLLFL
jgi:hypothetical protein